METTSSFATSPVMVATAAFQAQPPAQPRGAKTQAMLFPMEARREVLLSSTWTRPPSEMPKPCKNQRMTLERRITVPARLIKDQPRSQVARSTLEADGRW